MNHQLEINKILSIKSKSEINNIYISSISNQDSTVYLHKNTSIFKHILTDNLNETKSTSNKITNSINKIIKMSVSLKGNALFIGSSYEILIYKTGFFYYGRVNESLFEIIYKGIVYEDNCKSSMIENKDFSSFMSSISDKTKEVIEKISIFSNDFEENFIIKYKNFIINWKYSYIINDILYGNSEFLSQKQLNIQSNIEDSLVSYINLVYIGNNYIKGQYIEVINVYLKSVNSKKGIYIVIFHIKTYKTKEKLVENQVFHKIQSNSIRKIKDCNQSPNLIKGKYNSSGTLILLLIEEENDHILLLIYLHTYRILSIRLSEIVKSQLLNININQTEIKNQEEALKSQGIILEFEFIGEDKFIIISIKNYFYILNMLLEVVDYQVTIKKQGKPSKVQLNSQNNNENIREIKTVTSFPHVFYISYSTYPYDIDVYSINTLKYEEGIVNPSKSSIIKIEFLLNYYILHSDISNESKLFDIIHNKLIGNIKELDGYGKELCFDMKNQGFVINSNEINRVIHQIIRFSSWFRHCSLVFNMNLNFYYYLLGVSHDFLMYLRLFKEVWLCSFFLEVIKHNLLVLFENIKSKSCNLNMNHNEFSEIPNKNKGFLVKPYVPSSYPCLKTSLYRNFVIKTEEKSKFSLIKHHFLIAFQCIVENKNKQSLNINSLYISLAMYNINQISKDELKKIKQTVKPILNKALIQLTYEKSLKNKEETEKNKLISLSQKADLMGFLLPISDPNDYLAFDFFNEFFPVNEASMFNDLHVSYCQGLDDCLFSGLSSMNHIGYVSKWLLLLRNGFFLELFDDMKDYIFKHFNIELSEAKEEKEEEEENLLIKRKDKEVIQIEMMERTEKPSPIAMDVDLNFIVFFNMNLIHLILITYIEGMIHGLISVFDKEFNLFYLEKKGRFLENYSFFYFNNEENEEKNKKNKKIKGNHKENKEKLSLKLPSNINIPFIIYEFNSIVDNRSGISYKGSIYNDNNTKKYIKLIENGEETKKPSSIQIDEQEIENVLYSIVFRYSTEHDKTFQSCFEFINCLLLYSHMKYYVKVYDIQTMTMINYSLHSFQDEFSMSNSNALVTLTSYGNLLFNSLVLYSFLLIKYNKIRIFCENTVNSRYLSCLPSLYKKIYYEFLLISSVGLVKHMILHESKKNLEEELVKNAFSSFTCLLKIENEDLYMINTRNLNENVLYLKTLYYYDMFFLIESLTFHLLPLCIVEYMYYYNFMFENRKILEVDVKEVRIIHDFIESSYIEAKEMKEINEVNEKKENIMKIKKKKMENHEKNEENPDFICDFHRKFLFFLFNESKLTSKRLTNTYNSDMETQTQSNHNYELVSYKSYSLIYSFFSVMKSFLYMIFIFNNKSSSLIEFPDFSYIKKVIFNINQVKTREIDTISYIDFILNDVISNIITFTCEFNNLRHKDKEKILKNMNSSMKLDYLMLLHKTFYINLLIQKNLSSKPEFSYFNRLFSYIKQEAMLLLLKSSFQNSLDLEFSNQKLVIKSDELNCFFGKVLILIDKSSFSYNDFDFSLISRCFHLLFYLDLIISVNKSYFSKENERNNEFDYCSFYDSYISNNNDNGNDDNDNDYKPKTNFLNTIKSTIDTLKTKDLITEINKILIKYEAKTIKNLIETYVLLIHNIDYNISSIIYLHTLEDYHKSIVFISNDLILYSKELFTYQYTSNKDYPQLLIPSKKPKEHKENLKNERLIEENFSNSTSISYFTRGISNWYSQLTAVSNYSFIEFSGSWDLVMQKKKYEYLVNNEKYCYMNRFNEKEKGGMEGKNVLCHKDYFYSSERVNLCDIVLFMMNSYSNLVKRCGKTKNFPYKKTINTKKSNNKYENHDFHTGIYDVNDFKYIKHNIKTRKTTEKPVFSFDDTDETVKSQLEFKVFSKNSYSNLNFKYKNKENDLDFIKKDVIKIENDIEVLNDAIDELNKYIT